MVSQKVTLTNGSGLHMRPAGVFAKGVAGYASKITIITNGKEVDGKSMMSLMAASIKCGAEIEIRCEGEDEQAALDGAIELIESGLGE